MRLLTVLVVVFSGLWGGYWYIGSSAVETAIKDWLENAPRQGVMANYSTLETRGFPNRFDTTITEANVVVPELGFQWDAPFFQVFALSYKPYHIVAVWPNEQHLSLLGRDYDITSDDLRASLVVEPNTTLALDRFRLTAEALRVRFTPGLSVSLANALIATRQNSITENAHDLALEISGLEPPEAIRLALDPDRSLPDRLEAIKLDSVLEFDAPITVLNAESGFELNAINIRNGSVSWGENLLAIEGRLDVDQWGYATGELMLTARHWREVFGLLSAAGMVDPVWEGAIAPLAAADGDPEHLRTTLSFRDGAFYFGPLALGYAPRLR